MVISTAPPVIRDSFKLLRQFYHKDFSSSRNYQNYSFLFAKVQKNQNKFCIFCTFTHLFSPTIPLIFFFFRFLLSRFSTIQYLMSDVRCFARFLFCSPCSSVRSVYDGLYVLPSSAPPRFAKHNAFAHAGGFAQFPIRLKNRILSSKKP